MAKKPIKLVNIEVDGNPHVVRDDQYLLWSLRELGYDIPHFCAHNWLEPFGGCRMCLVKIELGGRMMPKLQTSCSTKPAEGMKVFTRHAEVLKAREEELEFHLINHPLECPVCDKGGECMLQDQVFEHGLGEGRFVDEKRVRPDAIVSELIRMNYKRCIQCKRCVHYCQDIDGSQLLKFVQRGAETRIEGFPIAGVAPRFTGNVIDICPVGALTAREYRFMGRPWEQQLTASIGSLDSVGTNIWICSRMGHIARIIPRNNPAVENGMLDDATRFCWEAVEDGHRLERGLLHGTDDGMQVVSRAAGETEAARLLFGEEGSVEKDSIGVIAGNGLNTEEYFALKLFCGTDLNTAHYFFGDELFGGLSADDIALSSLINSCAPIEDILASSTVLSLGCDLFEEAPALGLRLDLAARRGQLKLLSTRSHGSEADRFAKRAQVCVHGSLLRRVRALTNHLTGQGEAPELIKELAAELRNIGEDCAIVFGQEVWASPNPVELLHAIQLLKQAISTANPDALSVHLNPVFPAVNSAGALLVQFLERLGSKPLPQVRPGAASMKQVLQAAAANKLKCLLVVDADLLSTYPDRALVEQALAAVPAIYIGSYPNPTAERAAVQLPLGTWAHREGTVINLEWRIQRRSCAGIDSFAPSVLDVINDLAAVARLHPVAEQISDLAAALGSLLPGYPAAKLEDLSPAGVLWIPPALASDNPKHNAELPPMREPAAGKLLLICKHFMYNDRPEISFSKVFDRIAKPFSAYINEADIQLFKLREGEPVEIRGAHGAIVLPLQAAAWVSQGSVVVNDYCLAAPANKLGASGAEVSVSRPAVAAGS